MTAARQRTLLMIVLVAGLGGCDMLIPGSQAPQPSLIAPSGQAAQAVGAVGGIDAWKNIASVRYRVVLQVWDDQATRFVNRHAQKLDLDTWTLTAVAQQPDGTWAATVDRKGACAFDAGRPQILREPLKKRLSWALPMAKHRVAGALNLMAVDRQTAPATAARLNGIDVLHMPVSGQTSDVKAYYLGATNDRLLYLTAGADAPNQEGNITHYEYTQHENGLWFPSRITVLKIGQHALIGTEKILEMDIEKVVFQTVSDAAR